ncbi:MAG TPA: hypothetical protein VFV38_30135 [Ktedonobacteraceae bacterium]|nr:hypothetical protein [Ktedonobacteraceae bacterium]
MVCARLAARWQPAGRLLLLARQHASTPALLASIDNREESVCWFSLVSSSGEVAPEVALGATVVAARKQGELTDGLSGSFRWLAGLSGSVDGIWWALSTVWSTPIHNFWLCIFGCSRSASTRPAQPDDTHIRSSMAGCAGKRRSETHTSQARHAALHESRRSETHTSQTLTLECCSSPRRRAGSGTSNTLLAKYMGCFRLPFGRGQSGTRYYKVPDKLHRCMVVDVLPEWSSSGLYVGRKGIPLVTFVVLPQLYCWWYGAKETGGKEMNKTASNAALIVPDGRTNNAILTENEAKLIAESIDWSEVQKIAQTCRKLPALVATYVSDKQARDRVRAGLPATVALMNDLRTIDTVLLEASSPRYLELPAVIAALASHPEFLAARPLGRLHYRDAMYEKRGGYSPLRFERKEVLDFVHQVICLSDKRLAVAFSLAGRAGLVVGFLSGLFVAQPDEARNGLAIMAALVAPLLVAAPPDSEMVPAGNRAARRAAARSKSLPAPRKQGKRR